MSCLRIRLSHDGNHGAGGDLATMTSRLNCPLHKTHEASHKSHKIMPEQVEDKLQLQEPLVGELDTFFGRIKKFSHVYVTGGGKKR